MDLEDALCSKTKIKILKVLMKLGQLNTSQIAKKVGGNYGSVRKHLEILGEEGILEMSPCGSRVHYYRFNQGSAKALAVQALLCAWERQG